LTCEQKLNVLVHTDFPAFLIRKLESTSLAKCIYLKKGYAKHFLDNLSSVLFRRYNQSFQIYNLDEISVSIFLRPQNSGWKRDEARGSAISTERHEISPSQPANTLSNELPLMCLPGTYWENIPFVVDLQILLELPTSHEDKQKRYSSILGSIFWALLKPILLLKFRYCSS